MTTLITALSATMLLLALAVFALVTQALRILCQDRHMAALIHAANLEREAADIMRRRAALLETALTQHQERIGLLIAENGELADRNACLERVQNRNLRAAIAVMPVLDVADALHRISAGMN